jgi:hypothetical protein
LRLATDGGLTRTLTGYSGKQQAAAEASKKKREEKKASKAAAAAASKKWRVDTSATDGRR